MATVFLSERNLKTLLSKLERERKGEQTSCTIIKYQHRSDNYKQSMKQLVVVAVRDDEYYPALGRLPGIVHEGDEVNL